MIKNHRRGKTPYRKRITQVLMTRRVLMSVSHAFANASMVTFGSRRIPIHDVQRTASTYALALFETCTHRLRGREDKPHSCTLALGIARRCVSRRTHGDRSQKRPSADQRTCGAE